MKKRQWRKVLTIIAASLAGLVVVLFVASILVFQSGWFSNFVRDKIIAVTEASTGGVVEIGSFQFQWTHLTARVRNFVLHGTEPKGADPLVRIPLLEVQLKLFAGLEKAVDIQYLGVHQPQVNLIVLPDGTTNVPQPKIQKQSGENSGLETVVNLAVNQFQIENGLLKASQTPFSARGENLRVLLNYNFAGPNYQGNLSMDPLLLTAGKGPPINAHVNVPVTIEKDAVRIADAKLNTDQSQIVLNASIQNINAPLIDGKLNASISLREMQRSLDLPIDANGRGVPNIVSAELAMHMDEKNNTIQIQTAHFALGQTTFQASGTLNPSKNGSAQFNASFALGELSRLLRLSTVKAAGNLQANGKARLDAHNDFSVDGTLNSRGLSVRSGTTRLSNISLYSPFHADPYLVSLDGLKVNALGGNLAAKIFMEKMQRLSVEGNLRNLSLPGLAQAFTGKHLGYDGTIDGYVKAKGDLKAKGTAGYSADASLSIIPGHRGVPVNGRLNARYVGASDTVEVGKSYLQMPNSRIEIAGALNRSIDVTLQSSNLNDFLPAANFGASKPESALPVSLQGGTATLQAQITGNLSAPHIVGHAAMNKFAVEQRSFDRFAVDLDASPSYAAVQNGVLTRRALQTGFNASIGLNKWNPVPRSPLKANVSMRNGDLADLLSFAGESSIPASGDLNADVHIDGTYGDPLGSASLQIVDGIAYQQPFQRLYANVNLADQLITLSTLELDAAGGRVNVSGTFQHPRDSFSIGHAQVHVASTNVQLGNVKPLQNQNAGVAGLVQLTADAAVDVRQANEQSQVTVSNVSADLTGRGFRVQNQAAGDLTATVRTQAGNVAYNVTSDFAGSRMRVNGQTALSKNYFTTADASIQDLSIEKTLLLAGQSSIPARGNLSANAHLAGTLESPSADLSFALTKANIYQEPINGLQGRVRYASTLVDIPSIELNVPAGSVTLTGSFVHPANDFNAGSLTLKVSSSDIQMGKITHVQEERPGLAGTLHLAADLSANLREQNGSPTVLISNLNADASANELRLNNLNLGQASFTARTAGSNLNFRLDSDIARSQIHGSGQSQLSGDYPVQASLTFANIKYSNLAPFISEDPAIAPSFDALVEGQASVNGPILKTDDLNARLELSRVEAQTHPHRSPTGAPPGKSVTLQNEGPLVMTLDHSVVRLQQIHLKGPGTNIDASGALHLKNTQAPLAVNLNANTDLSVLQDIDRDFYSSGTVSLNTAIHGSFSQPLVNGRVELKNANVNYANAPNGLSNANGVILLNGTSASIQNLRAESGGGKIAMTGFVGLTGSAITYNLRAMATKVRVRYSGISATSNASLNLTGNTNRSLLGGTVTVERIAYGSSSDAGSILSSFTSTPPTTPSAPSGIITGMRLDIHVLTAPDLRVITTYANRLAVEANLTVRGTAENPGVIGRMTVTDGELVFFGNHYTVNSGTINFYDPNAINPVINISLETIAQNVDVIIGVSGPMDNLKLSYRSDPPLSFEQIVSLLATNTTPSDPTIAAQQPAPPQQSLGQMGESAILGQAVADPLASRVQRVFGMSQFKIDPSFSGSNGQPSARVTLQQKIANNITFTYITDVTQTNSEIIRVEWAFTPTLSAVGLRDFNGNVSLEFFYKFKVR